MVKVLPTMTVASLSVTLLMLMAASTAAQETAGCTPILSEPLFLDEAGLVSLQQSKNTADGTFTMRLTYGGPPSWIGVGVNLDGRAKMTPTQSVIGRVDENDATATSVLKYRLASDDEDASGVLLLPDELQADLMATSFTQDFDAQETVLEFTHPLADVAGDMVVTDESFWVFAVGNPDNMWTGRHVIHGGFQLPLTDSCVPEEEVDDNNDETASSPNGISLIGTEKEGESLYLAHGICMAVAWGIFAPLAIGVSFARNTGFLQQNANWLKMHFFVNIAVVLITTVGFALAVAATGQNSTEHFKDNAHTKAGLAIFLLVFVQALTGYFRPAAGAKPKTLENDDDDKDIRPTVHGSSALASSPLDNSAVLREEHPLEQPTQSPAKTTLRRSWEIGHRVLALVLIALAWYNCTSGIQLQVALFAEDASSETVWMSVFWAVTACISAVFLVMGVWQRRRG